MCGHYTGTTQGDKPSHKDIYAQFRNEIGLYDIKKFSVISIYNSGSMLNPEEIETEALEQIFLFIKKTGTIKKVVIESRAEYVKPEPVKHLSEILGNPIKLSVAMGLETHDDIKRDLCLNKGCSLKDIEDAVNSLKGIAETQLYVLLGLPFLTESETIEDTTETLKWAADSGADEIHIEPVTLQKNTFIELLVKKGLYKLPSIYSVYEVLKKVVPEIRPYVSPFMHMPLPEKIPGGCPKCTDRLVKGLLENYNIRRDRKSLEYPECDCIGEWRKRLSETDKRPLTERISDIMTILHRQSSRDAINKVSASI